MSDFAASLKGRVRTSSSRSSSVGGATQDDKAASEANKNKRDKTGGRQAVCVSNYCPWCWSCLLTTPNPIRKQAEKCPTISRSKKWGPCNICRNVKSKYYPNHTDVQMTTGNAEEGEFHEKYMVCWNCYVALKNGDPLESVEGWVAPASRDGPETTVTRSDVKAAFEKVITGHFWPVDTLWDTLQVVAAPSAIIPGDDAFGTPCQGVWRLPQDDPETLPRRVKVRWEERKQEARKDIVLDRSADHVREGQGKDAWEAAQKRATAHLENVTVDEEGNQALLMRSDAATAGLNDDGGGDDYDDDDDFAILDGKSRLLPLPAAAPGKGSAAAAPAAVPTGPGKGGFPKGSHSKAGVGDSQQGQAAGATKGSGKGGDGKSGAAPKTATPKKDKPVVIRMGWQARQAAKRELVHADKAIANLALLVSTFAEDALQVNLKEAIELEKKLQQRLDEENRWVYIGEDSDFPLPSNLSVWEIVKFIFLRDCLSFHNFEIYLLWTILPRRDSVRGRPFRTHCRLDDCLTSSNVLIMP